MTSERVLIIAGGEVGDLPPGLSFDVVIAADSGLDAAYELSFRVDYALGDFDSVSSEALERAERDGLTTEAHPAAKNASDLELALDLAVERKPSAITVIGLLGGRADHYVGNLALLASPRYAGVKTTALLPPATVHVVHDYVVIHGQPGELLSLFAMGGPAHGITTSGLHYPLINESLEVGSTRGLSNELSAPVATVAVTSGVVLAISPGVRGTHVDQGLHL